MTIKNIVKDDIYLWQFYIFGYEFINNFEPRILVLLILYITLLDVWVLHDSFR